MRTLVIIPCKNLEAEVGDVVRGVTALELGLDAVVVNDGSTDGTSEAARDAGAPCVEHEVNLGKGAALKTGFEYADREGVRRRHHDGRRRAARPRSAIPDFLDALEKCGADMVVGTRMDAVGEMPKLRDLDEPDDVANRLALARQDIPDSQSGYRLIKVRVARRTWSSLRHDAVRHGVRDSHPRRQGVASRSAPMPIESIYTGGRQPHQPVRRHAAIRQTDRSRHVWRRHSSGDGGATNGHATGASNLGRPAYWSATTTACTRPASGARRGARGDRRTSPWSRPDRERSAASHSLTWTSRCARTASPTTSSAWTARRPTACCSPSRTCCPEPPDLMVSGHQPRTEHGRRRHVLRDGRRGDGGDAPGHPGDGGLARPTRASGTYDYSSAGPVAREIALSCSNAASRRARFST